MDKLRFMLSKNPFIRIYKYIFHKITICVTRSNKREVSTKLQEKYF